MKWMVCWGLFTQSVSFKIFAGAQLHNKLRKTNGRYFSPLCLLSRTCDHMSVHLNGHKSSVLCLHHSQTLTTETGEGIISYDSLPELHKMQH